MSVLIKRLELPKKIDPGITIEFADGIDGKRYARLYYFGYGGLTEWLEAVPVPEHGRFLKVLKTERECVSRDCNRDCGKCDLSLEQDEILSAYDTLIALFADTAEERASDEQKL